jgi:hypothetical protein
MAIDTGREIAPPAPVSLAHRGGQHDELDAFQQATSDELILPTVKLVQGVSRLADSKQAGRFWHAISGEYRDELLVAILAMSRSRSLFGASFDQPPICASDDAVTPRQPVEVDDFVTGPTCAECRLSQWGTAQEGRGRGQACRFSYNLLCLDLDDRQPFILRISGASLKAWRQYLTDGRLKAVPAYGLETRVSSEEEVFASGKAYVLRFRRGAPLDAELTEVMREQAAAYRGIALGVEERIEDVPLDAPDEAWE